MIRESIAKLVERQPLSRDEAYQTLKEVIGGEATPAQIASFITALRMAGETAEVIAGCAQVMREAFTPVDCGDAVAVDVVGTGGDGANTFNISTTAAFVVAGAGVHVAKHGNKGVSSRSGAADVLEALGVKIMTPPEVIERCLRETGIAFLFAPCLHPAMKHAIGPRREIGIRTVFNLLGPLCNPADTRRGLLGVYDDGVAQMLAEASAALDAEHLFVVHGRDGLDEMTTTGPTVVREIIDGRIDRYEVTPEQFGLPRAKPEDLKGGDPAENAAITRAILAGETGPRRDIVLLNAAAALVSAGAASDLSDGMERARKAIDEGRAADKLTALIECSNR
jgi:anthranilate phosphoribosyltransferase